MSVQFEFTRGSLLKFVKELDEQRVDVMPTGFNKHYKVAYRSCIGICRVLDVWLSKEINAST